MALDISQSTQQASKGRDYIYSLPYDDHRVTLFCGHSFLYLLSAIEDGPLLCGLCFFKDGFAAELPTRFHLFKTLAENGNPETDSIFISHLYLVMGLKPPKPGEPLWRFRKRRNPRTALAREQYTRPVWGLFPVASSLWKLMGYQPPLGVVLVRGVSGRTEVEIAADLDLSLMDVHIRMAKAIRTAMGYLPHGDKTERIHSSGTGGDDQSGPESTGSDEPGIESA